MGDHADDLMFREIGLPDTEFFTGKKEKDMQIKNTKDGSAKFMSYLISGASKTGKTVLATTIPSNELLFGNVENNLASIYGADVNMVDMFTYDTAKKVVEALEQRQITPKWFFLDSGTELAKKILREEMSRTKDGRAAYGEMAQKMTDLIRRLKVLPLNFVMIAQQGYIKDEITGGVIFGASFPGQTLEKDVPYMFDAVLAARIVKDQDGKDTHVLQCHPCPQYSAGVRTKFKADGTMSNPLAGFERPNLSEIHNKILN